MEEIMYGKDQFKKKNGYERKKTLTPNERKEKTALKHSKLVDKLDRLSKKNPISNLNDCENDITTKASNNKLSTEDLMRMVKNIENK